VYRKGATVQLAKVRAASMEKNALPVMAQGKLKVKHLYQQFFKNHKSTFIFLS
jgi:hypothetical protein